MNILTKIYKPCGTERRGNHECLICLSRRLAALFIAATLAVIILTLLAGCGSLVPSERMKSQSVQAAENLGSQQERTIRRVLEVTPQSALVTARTGTVAVVSQPSVKETISIESKSSSDAGSTDRSTGTTATTMPYGVKVGLLGAGVLLLVVALRFAWASLRTTAVGEGIAAGDAALAAYIRSKRAEATTSTDPATIARTMGEVASLEAERGRLAAAARK